MKIWPPVVLTFFALAAAHGDWFVSSFNGNDVLRYTDAGAFISTFVSANSGGLNQPHRAVIGPDGNLYVASAGTNSVLKYNPTTGAFISAFVSSGSGGLNYPVDLLFAADGDLYVSSQSSNGTSGSIKRYNGTTGAFIDTFVATGTGGMTRPSGIAIHNGELFVADRATNNVERYNGTTGASDATFGSAVLQQPFGLDIGSDGNVYVASGNNSTVAEFNSSTGAFIGNFVSSGSGGLASPKGVVFGPDGNLYVASFNTPQAILEYNGSTGASIGTFASGGGLTEPTFFSHTAAPEPGAFVLVVLGLGALGWARRRGG